MQAAGVALISFSDTGRIVGQSRKVLRDWADIWKLGDVPSRGTEDAQLRAVPVAERRGGSSLTSVNLKNLLAPRRPTSFSSRAGITPVNVVKRRADW